MVLEGSDLLLAAKPRFPFSMYTALSLAYCTSVGEAGIVAKYRIID